MYSYEIGRNIQQQGRRRKTKHIRKLITSGDYLTACQLIKARLDDRWPRLLSDVFATPRYVAKDIHKHIYDLDNSLILTPNFDKIYETAALQFSESSVRVKPYTDQDLALILRGGLEVRAILKVHGTIDNIDTMIFTREDYASSRAKNAGFFNILDALLLTHTFVFLGCGLSDPDLALLLEKYSYTQTPLAPHYAIMPGPINKDIVQAWRRNFNVRVIIYSAKDHHIELEHSVGDLVTKVRTLREDMARRMLW